MLFLSGGRNPCHVSNTTVRIFDFEGHKFYGPKDYDTALRTYYGDYMIIPPKEQQISHAPLFVDLARGYTLSELKQIIANTKK